MTKQRRSIRDIYNNPITSTWCSLWVPVMDCNHAPTGATGGTGGGKELEEGEGKRERRMFMEEGNRARTHTSSLQWRTFTRPPRRGAEACHGSRGQ